MTDRTISQWPIESVPVELRRPSNGPSAGLRTLLVERLNRNSICYCHWKSNFGHASARSEEEDLDLLVDRRSVSDAMAILHDVGFKPAFQRAEPATPGVSHYYAMDPSSGELVHVHLFTRVLTGESFLKSHHLPLETMLLENTDTIGAMRVAAKAAELLVLVLRMFIKYGSWLDVAHVHKDRARLRAELEWLQSDETVQRALALLRTYCPAVDEVLFRKCLESLHDRGSLPGRLFLARRVRWRLRVYAVRGPFRRSLAYAGMLARYAWRRCRGRRKNKVLQSGGAVIALTGPEATGKSTLASETSRWLGRVFAVRTVHVGKPPSAYLTLPVNMVVPLMRRLLPHLRSTRQEGHSRLGTEQKTQDTKRGFAAVSYALAAVLTAWDRRSLLLQVRRAAASGEIVICDRYPSELVGAMDSPRLHLDSPEKGTVAAVCHRLARLERRLYRDIAPPDVVLRLHVSIASAKDRNRLRTKAGKESAEYVESRHRRNPLWQRTGTRSVHDISTDQDLQETILCVKKAIWTSL